MSETVSFIVPCFNEAENIRPLYEAFRKVFNVSPYEWELIYVDDGSKDDTFKVIGNVVIQAEQKSERVSAIQFSRNFGKDAAIYAGLRSAKGSIVGIIDGDLQQPPEDALQMVNILTENNEIDSVAAYQKQRKESIIMSKFKKLFYKVFSKIAKLNIIENASDFRVMKRPMVNAILDMPESGRFSKGIFAWVGFNTQSFPYEPSPRAKGNSKYSTLSLIKYAFNGIISFSTVALRFAIILGFIIAVVAIVYAVIVVMQTLLQGVQIPGYATLLTIMLLLGAVQLFCIGILGEYIGRDYLENKSRPIYIKRKRITSWK